MGARYFLAAFFGLCLSVFAEPVQLNLDGREVDIMFYYEGSPHQTYRRKAVIDGDTIVLDFDDVNDSAPFFIPGAEQSDDQVRLAIGDSLISGTYKKGRRISLPTTPAQLGGKEVAVRIFRDWADHPENYERGTAKVFGKTIKLDFEGVDDSAFVAIFGADQQDEQIRKLIGASTVWGWLYKPGCEIRLPDKAAADANEYHWTFVDALGEPIGPGRAQMYIGHRDAKIPVDSGPVNERGEFTTAFNISSRDAQVERAIFVSTYKYFVFSHPQYGVCEMKLGGSHRRSFGGVVVTPFVPAGSQADERCVRGRVVDAEGNPIAGALVELRGIQPLGGEYVRPCQKCAVRTDQAGFFRAYLPVDIETERIGWLVPPNATYLLRILPPGQPGFEARTARVSNTKEETIVLERGERYFHTFAFEDENGLITDRLMLYQAHIRISRPDDPDIFLAYDDFKNGGMFPAGTYRAWMPRKGMDADYIFEPIEVTADSPEKLVFKPPAADKVYYGRVVDGITGEPIEGAFVVDCIGSSSGRNLSMLTDEQWAALDELPSEVARRDKDYSKILDSICYIFSKLVRTDSDGRFELRIPKDQSFNKIVIFNRNYLTVITDRRKCKSEGDCRYAVPLTRLFPAAKVTIETCADDPEDDRHPALWAECIIDRKNNPAWVHRLLSAWDVEGSTYMDDIRNDFLIHLNTKLSFPVPAGLNISLQLRPRYGEQEKRWSPVTIAEHVNLEQGQVFDAGRVKIEPAFEVLAMVVNSQQEPIEGVPVIARDQYGQAISNTDENGVALFRLARDSAGEFAVEHKDEARTGPLLKESVAYKLLSPDDANNVYTLQLSDEMMESLFGGDMQ